LKHLLTLTLLLIVTLVPTRAESEKDRTEARVWAIQYAKRAARLTLASETRGAKVTKKLDPIADVRKAAKAKYPNDGELEGWFYAYAQAYMRNVFQFCVLLSQFVKETNGDIIQVEQWLTTLEEGEVKLGDQSKFAFDPNTSISEAFKAGLDEAALDES
jgi:hypothetical protein